MADRHTTQSHDTEKVKEKRERPGLALESWNGLESESVVLDTLLGGSAADLPVERHAALLGDARFSHPANAAQKARLVSRLQRQYGNAYVQKVLSVLQLEQRGETLQAKETPGQSLALTPTFGIRIPFPMGDSQCLSKSVSTSFEPRFGIDFSQQQNVSKSMLERQAKEEELTIPKLEPIFGAGRLTYTYEGEKALAGAAARWESTYDIDPWPLPKVEQKGKKWFGVLNRCNLIAKIWLSSTTKWNDIKDFPGGSYVDNFNTKEGSKTHEKAELGAVRPLWEKMQTNIKEGIKEGFPTEINARGNYQRVWGREHRDFMSKWAAISDHKNPVGPNAEWGYYKAEYAKYKASLPKGAPEKKAP